MVVNQHSNDARGRTRAVIVNYNRAERLAEVLAALQQQTRPLHSIVVFDNSSSDESSLVARAHGVEWIDLGENTGASGGFCAGTSEATDADWLLLLTDDCVVQKDLVERLEAVSVAQHPMALVSSLGRANGKVSHAGSRQQRGRLRPVVTCPDDRPYHVDAVVFGGLLVPLKAIETIGAVRGDLFMMWEEYDFCLRARDAGYPILVLPEPLVDLGSQPSRYPPWRHYYQARNWMLSIRGRSAWRESPQWLLSQLKHLAAGVLRPDRSEYTRLRILGCWHGLRGVTGRTIEPS